MRLKPGIKIAGVRPEIVLALTIAAGVYREVADIELVVTEVTGGKHGRGSLHYVGLAADLRTRNLTKEQKNNIALLLREKLGAEFDVVLEETHIHLEFQPK